MDRNEIKQMAYALGAEVCGIADVERFHEAPEGFHPRDIYKNTRSVVVYGRENSKEAFDLPMNSPYTFERNKLLALMDEVTFRLCLELRKAGHAAIPIPSAEPYDYWDAGKREGRGILSLRHAGKLAGLGALGKNTLLVNKAYGNRLWLGALLTDAAFAPDPLTADLCPEDCSICIEACPQGALDGTTINQKKCREICMTVTESGGLLYACNECRKACPHSRD